MSTKSVNLQFCGQANKIQGPHGEFFSMELNKEQLAKIITDFQNENGFVDLSIAEKKERKPDTKNSHYVYSNVRYQDGQDTSGEVNIRIFKDRLSEVPSKEEHRAYFATISPVDRERCQSEGKETGSDFTVYVKDRDTEQNYYIGAGWDIRSQREASREQNSAIEICGNASLREKDSKPFFSASLNKEKMQHLFDVFAQEKFIDLTLAEKKEHVEGEKTGYYIYPSLKYQNEKDGNPKAVMTLRVFREEFMKAKAFNDEHSVLAGVYPRDKERDAAEGRETKSDYMIYSVNPANAEENVYLGAGFNREGKKSDIHLKEGDPVHIKVNDPVLKEFIGHTDQAAFGYVIARKADNYKVHCCCGTYWISQTDIKKATIEHVASFDRDYQDMRTRLTQDKSGKSGKARSSKKEEKVEKASVDKPKKDISDDL
jgi:ribosomal protein L21E